MHASKPIPDTESSARRSDLVALAIAITKATPVVAFFMHVKGSTSMIRMSAVSGFFAFVLADVLTRPGIKYFL